MSISRRLLLIAGLPAILSACQTTSTPASIAVEPTSRREPSENESKKTTSETAKSPFEVAVTEVKVSFGEAILKSGRTFDLPRSEIEQIVTDAMRRELIFVNSHGKTPAVANVTISSVFIANPASAILVGASSSTINARTQLIDAATDVLLGRGMDVGGLSGFRPSVFGATAIKSPKEEIELAARSLAKKTKKRIYGDT